MKKQILFATILFFAIALFVPTFSVASSNGTAVTVVDNNEKKDDTKKAACANKEANKGNCTEAQKKECAKQCTDAKKAECKESKSECCKAKGTSTEKKK